MTKENPAHSSRPFLFAIAAGMGYLASITPLLGQNQDGTWNSLTSGNWGDNTKWSSGVANGAGQTAFFNNLDITSNVTVTLDTPRTIGSLVLQDTGTTNTQIYTIAGAGSNILTLGGAATITSSSGSVTSPTAAHTVMAAIAGSAGLIKSGTGALSLNAINTYSGTTRIDNGQLNWNNNSSFGTSSININTVATTSNGLFFNQVSGSVTLANTVTGTGRLTKTGGATLILTADNSHALTRLQNGTLEGSDSTVYSGDADLNNPFGAALDLAATGVTLNLRANGQNDNSSQTLRFNTPTAMPSGSTGSNYNINVDRQAGTGSNKTLSLGSLSTLNGTFNVTGGNSYSLEFTNVTLAGGTAGSTTLNPTSANVKISGNITTAGSSSKTLVLDGTSTGNSIAGVISNQSGTFLTSVTKSNSSTWTLSGANTYTGATTVNGGKLVVNGSLASGSTVLIGTAGTLGGSGTINGPATVNGRLAPGNSPGVQSFGGSLTLNSTAKLEWELISNTGTGAGGTRGSDFDGINVAGALTIDVGSTADLVFNGAGSAVDFNSSFWDTSRNWIVFAGASDPLTSGAIFGTINPSVDAFGNPFSVTGGTLTFTESGNDILLNYVAVPEPRPLVLLGFAGFLFFQRMRRGITFRKMLQ